MGHLTDPDEPSWTFRERFDVAWDRSSIRWLVGVLAVVVILVGLLTLRSRPAESVTVPQIVRSGTPASATGPDPSITSSVSLSPPATETPETVIVHVTGPVRSPGVVTLAAGARVTDAVTAAGGLTKGKVMINLARVLVDGEQIDVGATAEASEPVGSSTPGMPGSTRGPTGGTSQAGGKVSLNKATAAQLEELPRVGPVMAAKILEFRTQHGGFRSIEQLQEVSGIGDQTYAQLAPLVQL